MAAYQDGGLGLLGDPSRRAIFELLARRPSSVQELADRLPISRPAVSQHLKVLKDGGLVTSSAVGARRIYRLDPSGVTALRAWLDGVWSDALTSFQKFADADADARAAADAARAADRHAPRSGGPGATPPASPTSPTSSQEHP